MKTLIGTKGNMTQTYIEGFRIPVTKVNLGPCIVVQIKTPARDGYWSVQLGFGNKKVKNTSKPLQGHIKKIQITNSTQNRVTQLQIPRYIQEVKLAKEPEYKVGDVLTTSDIFKKGDVVNAIGITKGKGFAGGVKRFRFKGGPKTHGQSDRHRAPGSIGQTTTPGRVYKGKRMAGRMGSSQVTVKNLHVISIDSDENTMLISGALPGRIGGLLTINRIKAGSLKDLEHEVVATVVEGEPEAKTEGESQENES